MLDELYWDSSSNVESLWDTARDQAATVSDRRRQRAAIDDDDDGEGMEDDIWNPIA